VKFVGDVPGIFLTLLMMWSNVRTFRVYSCVAGVFEVVIGLMTGDVFAVVCLNEMLSLEDEIWRRYVPCP
jgi:hypothetical protein